MTARPGLPAPPLEPFVHRGRPYLRAALRASGAPGADFLVAPTLAGRYRVLELLSVGEMGVVLLGRDEVTRHTILIKALRPELPLPPPGYPDPAAALSAELRRARHALQTERRLLVRLRNAGCNGVPHPNDYVYDRNPALEAAPFLGPDGRPLLEDALIETEPYLILESISGHSLEALIERHHPRGMDEADALDLIRPVVATQSKMKEEGKRGRREKRIKKKGIKKKKSEQKKEKR